MSAIIMTRAEARKSGQNKYFTGKPCKNGHIAERYTASGTCQDCIRSSNAPVVRQHPIAAPDPSAPVDAEQHKDMQANVVTRGLIVYDHQVDRMREMVHMMTEARYPGIPPELLHSNPKRENMGCPPVYRYRVRMHHADYRVLDAMCSRMRREVEGERKSPHADLLAQMPIVHKPTLI